MTGSGVNTRVLADVAVTSAIRRVSYRNFFSNMQQIIALPCSQIIMETEPKKAVSKRRKASREKLAIKLERKPKWAEYGERNAKENKKRHK